MCVHDSSGDEVDYKNIEACQLEISTTGCEKDGTVSEYTARQRLLKRLNEELRKNKLPSNRCDIVVVLTIGEVKLIIEALHGEVSGEELDNYDSDGTRPDQNAPPHIHIWKDDSFHKEE